MEVAEEPFHTESKGAASGINPYFGEWRKDFKFPPISYAASADRRNSFRGKLQAELDCKYYFTDEVKVQITLHLDEQRIRETDKTADIDNFAKSILDALKGKEGILIDDCQIQSLNISWIDIYDESEWFEIEVKGHPDEFLLKDITLFEMPDGLWYPLSDHTWDAGQARPINLVTELAGPRILDAMTDFSKKMRAELRRQGRSRMQAYREAQMQETPARGFHKSRVEGQFPLVSLNDWKKREEQLLKSSPEKGSKVVERLVGFKADKSKYLAWLKDQKPRK